MWNNRTRALAPWEAEAQDGSDAVDARVAAHGETEDAAIGDTADFEGPAADEGPADGEEPAAGKVPAAVEEAAAQGLPTGSSGAPPPAGSVRGIMPYAGGCDPPPPRLLSPDSLPRMLSSNQLTHGQPELVGGCAFDNTCLYLPRVFP